MNQLVTFLGGHKFSNNDARFMQEGFKSALVGVMKCQLVAGWDRAIMDGVVITKVGTNHSHTAGYIYAAGEIFEVDATTGPLTDAGIPKFKIDISYGPNNPVTYESGDNKNVHHVRKLKLVISTDPDGLFAYNDIRTLKWHRFNRDKDIGDIHHQVCSVADYFNTTTGVALPGTKFEDKWVLCDGAGGRLDARGKVLVGYSRLEADYNATDGTKFGGAATRIIDAAKLPNTSPWGLTDPGHGHGITNGTGVFRFTGSGGTNNVPGGGWMGQDLAIVNSGTGITQNLNPSADRNFDIRQKYVTVMICQKIA